MHAPHRAAVALAAAVLLPAAASAARPAEPPRRTSPATFYVSSSKGSDDRTGRAPEPTGADGPWKTLARASTEYIPGDRILLRRGDTWHETFRPRGSGTPDRPILIGAYGRGPRPVLDLLDYRRDRSGIHLADQGHIRIVGLEFARCMTGIYAEYSDGVPTRRGLHIEDCFFHDSLHYQHYEDYPRRKIGLGICLFSHERDNRVVLADITITGCLFRRLASGIWTNSPDNFNKNASYVYNFAKMRIENCHFEEGYQWPLGIRGVAGGLVRNCVTCDIGRGFRSFNGVAGAMFFRCRDWLFEDSEWGFIDIGLGSGDGEAFDFEGNCDRMTMRRCLFHDTDGPGLLLCCYASDPHPNTKILITDCVLNGKSRRPIGLPRCAILNTTDWNQVAWRRCRFYLAPGEALMRVMDPEKDKKTTFVDCTVLPLADACRTGNLARGARATASSSRPDAPAANVVDGRAETCWQAAASGEQWLRVDWPGPRRITTFRLREPASSSIARYVIQCWDGQAGRWVGCFHGRGIGEGFIAPIVARRTSKVRLLILRTRQGSPALAEFEAYDETAAPYARPAR